MPARASSQSTAVEIGRVLRGGTAAFVAGCRVRELEAPQFGALVKVAQGDGYEVFGLIHDIHIDDDGLVRQLVTAENITPEVMADNRERRIVPIEMPVLTVGYRQGGQIQHALPPRPPLSLDVVQLCDDRDLRQFTERLGYLRLIVTAEEIPIGELVAAHIRQVQARRTDPGWKALASQEVITLLRDDYPTLMSVLGALGAEA